MNNRFQSFLSKSENNSRLNKCNEPNNRRRNIYENNCFRRENIIVKIKEIKVENNEIHFPSLNGNTKINEVTNTNKIEYVMALTNDNVVHKKNIKKNKIKKGWIQLGNNKQITYENKEIDYLFFVNCMSNLYECQRMEKIDILGEENYEANYKFQNYDYDYFEKKDMEEEKEFEYETRLNEMKNDESDNSI
jgi:hypothetical protein